jgi:Mrp family chromosome partitioning ATPase
MNVRRGDNGSEPVDAPEIRDAELTEERRITVYKGKPQQLQAPLQTDTSLDMAAIEQLDAFREVRTRLLAMGASTSRTHFTTLVVGITGSSGASFVARNLATAFTLQEQRVAMLVDCNLRNPTQHTVLGVRADEGGLFDYLDAPYQAIERLAHPTPIPGLHLIPAGRPSDMPREYFSSQNMKMLMAALKQAPCHVFMDGPPVKGSPDARILAELADFVVLVVGYASATPDEIGAAAKLFDPAKFAGVVFNDHA